MSRPVPHFVALSAVALLFGAVAGPSWSQTGLPGGGFGPGYDSVRPAPVAPATKGPGITSAKTVVAGDALVEELRDAQGKVETPFWGVVVEATLAPNSVTAALGASSVQLHWEGTTPATPLWAMCLPTQDPPLDVYREDGTQLATWNVAIGDQVWVCGGRTGRRVSLGGNVRLVSGATAAWTGPVVLLFKKQAGVPAHVDLAGTMVKLPASSTAGAAAN